MSTQNPPWESLTKNTERREQKPTMLVDLRRCIGCHACSVACKTEHRVPLGEFRMRVRWLPRPDRPGISFLPLFHADTCDFGANRALYGLAPACVDACPTSALVFGDGAESDAPVTRQAKRLGAKPLETPAKTRTEVLYVGQEDWHGEAIHAGVDLSPDDPDIIYEQGPRRG